MVGATGSIGKVCAELLAEDVAELWLIGRSQETLDELRAQLQDLGRAGLKIATDIAALSHCQLILTVTNAILSIIRPEHLQPAV